MSRFASELRRLYGLDPAGLTAADDAVRVMVLALSRPADWASLSAVWQGVQSDLAWPAPAIVVNGRDGYELWFALATPVPMQQAADVLAALRARYLAHLAPERVAAWPSGATSGPVGGVSGAFTPQPPVQEVAPGQWSAFLAQDLASLFGDEPWLDLAPSPEAQADLLSTLRCTPLADVLAALAPVPSAPEQPAVAPVAAHVSAEGPHADPRTFLLAVMNDTHAPLHLRIDAAKALLSVSGQVSPS